MSMDNFHSPKKMWDTLLTMFVSFPILWQWQFPSSRQRVFLKLISHCVINTIDLNWFGGCSAFYSCMGSTIPLLFWKIHFNVLQYTDFVRVCKLTRNTWNWIWMNRSAHWLNNTVTPKTRLCINFSINLLVHFTCAIHIPSSRYTNT